MKNRIILIIITIILFLITALTLSDDRNMFLTKPFKDAVSKIDSVFELKRDYVTMESTMIKELQKEIIDLKETLKLNSTLSEYNYINSTVVNRNIGYWYNNLTIDKGIKNGIENGDTVINSNGLIGKTIQCSNFSCTVKLLTNINNKISVKINDDDKYYYGLLTSFDSIRNVYKIEGVIDVKEVKEGLPVTTTGLTDYFPSGILIGRVSRIIKDEYDLTAIIEVTPSVDFNNINIVTVLKRKTK